MNTADSSWWVDDLTDVCVQFQLDLSCLVDGELNEAAAQRAIAHLEGCSCCRGFFDDARRQVRAHRELSDPEALIQNYTSLVGSSLADECETIELVHRLSSIFYQLGKAYVLLAVNPDYRTRSFEQPVEVGEACTEGRGFVDGVVASGRARGEIDWTQARHMLNGRLSRIESPAEKGRALLSECLSVDPAHEEALFFVAFLDAHEGRSLRAAQGYRQLFRNAIDPANRAHAAIQLGLLYADEQQYKKAIACCRWITISGVEEDEDRFFVARFNVGLFYAQLGRRARSLQAFRALLDRYPSRHAEVADLFLRSSETRAAIERQAGFAEELVATCPELFAPPEEPSGDPSHGSVEDVQ